MSTPYLSPAPITMFWAFLAISYVHSLELPTKTAVVNAMHLCPLDPKAAPTN